MKPVTSEWVEKAEADWRAAQREFNAAVDSSPDIVCFHAQQCVEKYLKARLIESGLVAPRTHNLLALLALVTPTAPGLAGFTARLSRMAAHAVEIRYPGSDATAAEAQEAVATASAVRAQAPTSLGLSA